MTSIHRLVLCSIIMVVCQSSSVIAHAGSSVALAGDSTVASGSGWGDELLKHLSSGSSVENRAIGGRSTKSFLEEGAWAGTVSLNSDYVFIQFGHNDQKLDDASRGTYPTVARPVGVTVRPRDLFRTNLLQMVTDVRSAGSIPVLITSVARRGYTEVSPGVYDFNNDNPGASDAQGNSYSLLDYVQATLAVADATDVPVINLNQLSLDLYTEMLENGEDITTLGPAGDNTHFNALGAKAIAKLVAEALPHVLPGSPLIARSTTFTNSTDFGVGADAQVSENGDPAVSGGNGTSSAINARWAPSQLRNEYILLRFDLSMITGGTVSNATLHLTSYRNQSSYTLNVYGLNDDAEGQQWDEASVTFTNAPGLSFDGDSSTRGLVAEDVTLLGTVVCPPTKGDVLAFAGTDGNVAEFLNTDRDGMATFLIERETISGGQSRFASKEATELDGGSPSGALGDFAPYLKFDALRVGPPVVANLPVSGLMANQATANGSLSSTGLFASVVGVLWGPGDGGTSPVAWANTNWWDASATMTPSVLSTHLSDLVPDTVYFYTFIATNAYGEAVATPSESFLNGEVWVEASDPGGDEDGDPAVFTVYRPASATNHALEINYRLGGSSSNGVDYAALNGSLTIPAGSHFSTVLVDPLSDGLLETNETVSITLTEGRYRVGSAASATAVITNLARKLAFYGAEGHGAEGAGRWARGGRGGDVYIVTTLNDGGPGSLREAVEASGPRTVVFEVAGTLSLTNDLVILNDKITIAGQTAPGDGVCLADRQLSIWANDVIVRFIRVRPGDNAGAELDAISVRSGTNIVIDHCSTSWSVDETLSVSDDARDVTVQWCMITESLNDSVHPKGEHGYGSLIRSHHGAAITYHHNLFAHHKARSPRPGNYLSHTEDPLGQLLDFRNNVIYNWGGEFAGYNADPDSVSRYNFINNYYVRGVNSTGGIAFQESCPYAEAYFAGNWMQHVEPADPWSLVSGSTGGDYKQAEAFDVEPVSTDTAPEAYSKVLAHVGVAQVRDPVDARVVSDVRNGTGSIIDDEQDVGGWPVLASGTPPLDTDRDGMPDDWELTRNLDPNDPDDRNHDRLGDGYSNLEEYLNGIAYAKLCKLSIVAGPGGSTSPSGDIQVGYGFRTNVVITPNPYWHIASIMLDEVPQPVTNHVALFDVQRDQVLTVRFAADKTTTHPTPHWWLAQHGLMNFEEDVTDDDDRDRMETWREYLAGTNPTNSASVFAILDAGVAGGTNYVSWYATTNSNVHTPVLLEYATDLINPAWTNLATVSRSASGTNVWTFPAQTNGGPPPIYRVQLTE